MPPALGWAEHARVAFTPAAHDLAVPTQTRLAAFDAEGSFLDDVRMLRGNDASPREASPPTVEEELPGTWIYGGVLRPHYGHFLLESLSRAWFLRRRRDLPILWHAANGRAVLPPSHREVLAMLGIPEGRMHVVLRPTRVERVILPAPGCIIERMLHPEQAEALAVFSAPEDKPPGRRLWLSRARLPQALAKVEGEVALEAELAAAGWQIVHPETLPVWRQVALLAAAEEISGFEGSAFHTVLLAQTISARITLLRRNDESFPASHALIAAAKGLTQRVLAPVLHPMSGEVEGRRRSVALADPAAVARELTSAGTPAAPWILGGHAAPPRALAFVHIPKTAGTSFTRALATGWPRTRVVGTQAEFDAIGEPEFAELDLVAGHFYAFCLEDQRLRDYAAVTVLRDPFERLFSAYRFGRHFARRGATVGPAMRLAGELDFGAWAFAPGGAAHRHAQLFQLGLEPGDKARAVPLGTLLQRAKARLDRMLFGTSEELDLLLGQVFRRLGRSQPTPTLDRAMTTAESYSPEEVGLTAAQRQTLMDALRPDFALHTHAREVMLRRLDQDGRGQRLPL